MTHTACDARRRLAVRPCPRPRAEPPRATPLSARHAQDQVRSAGPRRWSKGAKPGERSVTCSVRVQRKTMVSGAARRGAGPTRNPNGIQTNRCSSASRACSRALRSWSASSWRSTTIPDVDASLFRAFSRSHCWMSNLVRTSEWSAGASGGRAGVDRRTSETASRQSCAGPPGSTLSGR